MPATREHDFTKVPAGYIGVKEAAEIIGCEERYLKNRRWVRRFGLPAMQLRRGWPIYFDKKRLQEWTAKRSRTLKPERRHRRRKNATH